MIPKGNTYTWGFGLLETLWRVMEAIIDTRLRSSIQFENVLHVLHSGRGRGIATMEINLSQEVASVDQGPLFLVLLDPRKAYNTVDRFHLIRTLESYGAGPQMCNLLANFWARQEVVIRQNRYHGPNFMATWGETQVGLISLNLFNAVLDNVVQTWMVMTIEYQAMVQEILELYVGRDQGVFYSDNGIIGSRDSESLQNALNVVIGIFQRYGLVAKVTKL